MINIKQHHAPQPHYFMIPINHRRNESMTMTIQQAIDTLTAAIPGAPFADTTCCRLMGIDPNSIRHLNLANSGV